MTRGFFIVSFMERRISAAALLFAKWEIEMQVRNLFQYLNSIRDSRGKEIFCQKTWELIRIFCAM